VELVGIDDILGGQALAVVEFDAFAKTEDPRLGILGCFPAFGQFWYRLAVRSGLGEVVAQLPFKV
jgi:hypothetical protein